MNCHELADAYLDALRHANLAAMLGLFTDSAQVHSPSYGPIRASDFYAALFADTAESQLTLRGVIQGLAAGGVPLVSVWFGFGW